MNLRIGWLPGRDERIWRYETNWRRCRSGKREENPRLQRRAWGTCAGLTLWGLSWLRERFAGGVEFERIMEICEKRRGKSRRNAALALDKQGYPLRPLDLRKAFDDANGF